MGQKQKRERTGATGLGKLTRGDIEKKVESNDRPEIPDSGEASEMSLTTLQTKGNL